MSRCLAEMHQREIPSLQLALKTIMLANVARSGNCLAVRLLLEEKVNPNALGGNILKDVSNSLRRNISTDLNRFD